MAVVIRCSERARSVLRAKGRIWVVLWSAVRELGKTARISLPYAPGAGRCPPFWLSPVRGGPCRRYHRRASAPGSTTKSAMFDAHFPDLTMLAPTLGVLTAMISPAILILAAGTLITSTSNRLGRSSTGSVCCLRASKRSRAANQDGVRRRTAPPHLRPARQADEPGAPAAAQHDVLHLALAAFVATSVIIGLLSFVTPESSCRPTFRWWPRSRHVLPLHEQHPVDLRGSTGDYRRDRRNGFITTLGRRLAPSEWTEIPGASDDQGTVRRLAHLGAIALLAAWRPARARRTTTAATTRTRRPTRIDRGQLHRHRRQRHHRVRGQLAVPAVQRLPERHRLRPARHARAAQRRPHGHAAEPRHSRVGRRAGDRGSRPPAGPRHHRNFVDRELPFVPRSTTLATIFARANDINVVASAISSGMGGGNPQAWVSIRRRLRPRPDDHRNGIRDRASTARILLYKPAERRGHSLDRQSHAGREAHPAGHLHPVRGRGQRPDLARRHGARPDVATRAATTRPTTRRTASTRATAATPTCRAGPERNQQRRRAASARRLPRDAPRAVAPAPALPNTLAMSVDSAFWLWPSAAPGTIAGGGAAGEPSPMPRRAQHRPRPAGAGPGDSGVGLVANRRRAACT